MWDSGSMDMRKILFFSIAPEPAEWGYSIYQTGKFMGSTGQWHIIDLVLLAAYFAGITALGLWAGAKSSGSHDFFLPRRFGKWMMTMHAFGTGTASDQAVTVASATFRNGLSGIWMQLMWLFSTPFYWLIAPVFRRLRAMTTADVYELRFDRSVAVLFALIGIGNMVVKIGLMLKGGTALIVAATGESIAPVPALVVMTIIMLVYGVFGGLGAAILTDFVQGILTIVFSFMLLPLVLSAVGGMNGIRETIADPDFLALIEPGKFNLMYISMLSLQVLIGIVAQPFIMGVCSAGRTEKEGRFGFVVGNFLKRGCTIAWSLTALAAVALYMQRGIDPAGVDGDRIYGQLAQEFLPGLMPGMLGVFVACLLAGVMSSCDSFMVSAAALFTRNLYEPLFPESSDASRLMAGRLVAVLVVIGGVGFALYVPSVIRALEIWLRIAPMIGMAFWMGLLWKRMNVAGAWVTTLVGFLAWWLTGWQPFLQWLNETGAFDFMLSDGSGVDPVRMRPAWGIVFYLFCGGVSGMVAAFLTPPVNRSRLDRFYTLIETPVRPGEPTDRICEIPPGSKPGNYRKFLESFGLFLPVPGLRTQMGFYAAWVGVAGVILIFVGIVRWLP